ncbi:MBL fold metallo-hydrolase [Saccharopolyspora erythraea]|uniref:MBL fold metallo-hydrolase n=1 Tax=Saccharopolyspora erythraea TaxID=1836 RepID=UPI001BA94653|nr:MBL fold metallo-hydrolase [Saccharopolyspora erythraea]QUH06043.1 MBL fold metallo-hydrolase [Saccharopolyspora erythraea]
MAARVHKVLTSGLHILDGATTAVDNNVWLVGDDREVIVVDAAHDHELVMDAIGDRRVTAIACTHGHNDHINASVPLADEVGAPVLIHAEDRALWDQVNPDRAPDWTLSDGEVLTVAGIDLEILHTPGHTWGSVCLHAVEQGWLFSGDTLGADDPGATGSRCSDFPAITRSISTRLLGLDPDTTVYPGHGPATTIGAESPRLEELLVRSA